MSSTLVPNSNSICKIGMHISKDNLIKTTKKLLGVGSKAIQIYLSNKISFNPGSPLTKNEVLEIKKLRKEEDLYVVVHGKLILNLCQDDMRNIPALTCDIMEAARIDADVIIHQGKNVNKLSREEALTRYVLNIQEAIDQTAGLQNKIILENSCQQGTELGYHLDDLVTIWRLLGASEVNSVHLEGFDQSVEGSDGEGSEGSEEELEDATLKASTDASDKSYNSDKKKSWRLTNYQQRIGFCLDLCHAHVGGMINMRDPESVTKILDEFDKQIGLEHLTVIHFNDSEIKFDGHNDSHADILMGHIGNPDEPIGGNSLGFRKIVEYACRYKIPLIFETPGKIPMSLQLALVQGWANSCIGCFDLDIENLYLEKTQEIRDTFANDPKSRKGRKKTVATTATTIVKSTVGEPVKAPVKEPVKVVIKPKVIPVPPTFRNSASKPLLKVLPVRRLPTPTSTKLSTEEKECIVCSSNTD